MGRLFILMMVAQASLPVRAADWSSLDRHQQTITRAEFDRLSTNVYCPSGALTNYLTFTTNSGDVACGACIIGTYVYIGDAEWNATSDMINFSEIKRDAFGNSTLKPLRNVPKTMQKVFIDKFRVDKVRALRDYLNAKPAVFSGLDDTSDGFANSLLILGIIKAAPISIEKPLFAHMNLELEEV